MLQVLISEKLIQFAPAALIRLGYLYPDLVFKIELDVVVVENCSIDSERVVRRDISYTFYREKIYSETLSMRQALFDVTLRP